MVADGLCHLSMRIVSHVEESKRNLVKDVHRFARLGVHIEHSRNSGCMVYHNSESSLVVKVKSKQHLDQPLIELKRLVLGKVNESFSFGEGWCLGVSRKVVCSQYRWFDEQDS